jgi:lauroyl/myristoyl acyltransferase
MKLFEGFLWIIARVAVALLCLMPIHCAALVGRAGGGLMYYFDARHRRVASRNLALTFGNTKTAEEISQIVHENFRRIGENFCCAIKTTSIDDARLRGILEISRSQTAATIQAFTCRNVIFASGHFGSFELFSRIGPHFQPYRHAATYRGIRQRALEDLLCSLRGRFGLLQFERRRDAEVLKKELNAGGVMLMLFADQSDRMNGLELPFLGRLAFTNRAAAVMAARYDCSVFAPICYRVALGKYRIEVGEPISLRDSDGRRRSCEAITRDINAAHEKAILRDPANWFWVHNRWKQNPSKPLIECSGTCAAAPGLL